MIFACETGWLGSEVGPLKLFRGVRGTLGPVELTNPLRLAASTAFAVAVPAAAAVFLDCAVAVDVEVPTNMSSATKALAPTAPTRRTLEFPCARAILRGRNSQLACK